MNRAQAAEVLREWDGKGRYVFRTQDLVTLFSQEAPKTLEKSLKRLVKGGVLVRASRGVYVNPQARSFDPRIVIEEVAKALRPGEYNYVSLESMLSEYGAISQAPIDRITVMTTGREGIYRTPYGVIEFTHTARPIGAILKRFKRVTDRPLPIATKEAAWADLKRVGRNVGMVDQEMLNESDVALHSCRRAGKDSAR